MKAPPPLFNEFERQAVIDKYRLTDEGEDLGLNSIVRLAAQVFGVDMALVTLVEHQRQFFLGRQGIDICETGRDVSFCGHALTLGIGESLVVPDTALDTRFIDNPLVTGAPFVRFYAGCPMRTPEGHILGTLCIVDVRPRHDFSAAQRATLGDLAALAMDKLEARRLAMARSSSQSRFENITATSPDGIICADNRGRITFWNEACERLFG